MSQAEGTQEEGRSPRRLHRISCPQMILEKPESPGRQQAHKEDRDQLNQPARPWPAMGSPAEGKPSGRRALSAARALHRPEFPAPSAAPTWWPPRASGRRPDRTADRLPPFNYDAHSSELTARPASKGAEGPDEPDCTWAAI